MSWQRTNRSVLREIEEVGAGLASQKIIEALAVAPVLTVIPM